MSVGKRIKQLREDHLGLSQKEFGDTIFRGKSTISQLENDITELTPALRKTICRTFGVREEWLMQGSGSMMDDPENAAAVSAKNGYTDMNNIHRPVPESVIPYPEPMQANHNQLNDIQIEDDLKMAKSVLESGTGYATSLHMNIRSFKESVDEKLKREDLEAKQRAFENKVSSEIDSLKEKFNTLKAENSTLRTENNRLKATHEGPHGDDGSVTAIEKKAM